MPGLRIAIVAPLYESVPPQLYGGTERVVSYLTEALVRDGHDVTLFATGDSVTSARLRAMAPRGLRLDPACFDPNTRHVIMLDEVAASAAQFDVIHFHVSTLHFPLVRRLGLPAVTTVHGRVDLPELVALHRHFREQRLVSISQAQRLPIPGAGWVANVHHGLPPHLYRFSPGPGRYLAFLGRMSPEKRPDRAIRIARRAGIPLRMAAKIDRADEEYFDSKIRPELHAPSVEFMGEIAEAQKERFLGEALALLFPIDWPEPFGLVLLEAMACGTPVIAYPCGSVPEIVLDGVTGYVVMDEDAAAKAVEQAAALDRAACRRVFEERFTDERMARDYVRVYRGMLRAPAGGAAAATA